MTLELIIAELAELVNIHKLDEFKKCYDNIRNVETINPISSTVLAEEMNISRKQVYRRADRYSYLLDTAVRIYNFSIDDKLKEIEELKESIVAKLGGKNE